MKPMTQREIRRLAFRRRILESAEEIFVKKKYSSITTDEIAANAGVTKRTLYKHFASKLALFMSMFDNHLTEIAKKLSTIADTEYSPYQKMIMIWDSFYEFTKNNERFMRLYWMLDSEEFEGELPEELRNYVKAHINSLIMATTKVYDLAVDEGLIIDVDPLLLTHLLSAINTGVFIHVSKERQFGVHSPSADDLNKLARIIIRRGLASERIPVREKSRKSNKLKRV